MEWSVFTAAFRKVVGGSVSINETGMIQWNLRDRMGEPVSSGLYYLRVEVVGKQSLTKILKVLVLR